MIEKLETSPVTVIYVVGHLRTCGPSMQQYYLISNLDRSYFTPVVLVTTRATSPTDIAQRLRQIGVDVRFINSNKFTSLLVGPRELTRIARDAERVVLHPYGFRSDIISGLSGVRPRLGNVRNHLRYNYQRMFGRWFGVLISALNLVFLKRTDCVVACSSSVQLHLSSLDQGSIVIRNAIDPSLYRELMCSLDAPKRPTHSTPTYVTVASAIPGKKVEFLVEQFAAFGGERNLIVMGKAAPKLVEEYTDHAGIEFRGHVAKPGDVLLEAHYFISASEHEGMPNAVLESLSLGRPVVLSDIPSHVEILDVVEQDVGVLFTWSQDSLYAAIDKIEARNYEILSTDCVKAAANHLSAAEMARQYERIYKKLFIDAVSFH